MSAASDRDDRRRGEGEAMAGVVFRDPVNVEAEAADLQLAIARTLVNAPSLPVELPAFDLTLLGVVVDKSAIALVVGKSAPMAQLRLTACTSPTEPADVRVARKPVVDAAVVELHASAQRYASQLQLMAQRVRAAITLEKWNAALSHGQRLIGLPVGVPLAFYRQLVPGVRDQALIRTGFNCNQDCGICWQDRTWGRWGPEQTLMWIEDLHTAGARRLIISGGEPTLDRRLDEYIGRARTLGFDEVTLETNAIRFATPGLAEHLRDAGLTGCFISLHSGDPDTSDAITRAPGTFRKTVAGIARLLAAKIPVRLNCVMTREGIDHLGTLPDFVHATFGSHPYLHGLMLSQPSDPFDRSLLPSILPEPERVRTVLRAVIDRAFDLGVPISGLDGPCGPPLCAFAADRRITALAPIAERLDGRTYLAACESCAVRPACFGVRVADVELYGDACARPLTAAPAA